MHDQKKYWDKVAEEKDFPTPFKIEEFKRYVSKEMKILDVGCGYGRTLDELNKHGFKMLTGVDYSHAMIKRGLKLHPYLDLIEINNHIPFSDGKFDAVLLISVLTSNITSEEQDNLISEISRILKDDGILYISDFLINHDERNIQRYNRYKDKYGLYGVFELPEGAVLRHHTKEHIFKLTEGFQELIFEETVYSTMNGNKSNGFYYIAKKRLIV